MIAGFAPAGCDRCGAVACVPSLGAPVPVCPACAAGPLSPAEVDSPPVPEQLVRRTIDDDAARRALAEHVAPVPFRCEDADPARLGARLLAVWWPHWLVDVDAEGVFQVEAGFDYEVQSSVESYRSGGWTTQTVSETRTRWERRAGRVRRHYGNVDVPGLAEQPALEARIGAASGEPMPFDASLVSGDVLRLPDRAPTEQWPAAFERLRELVAADCARACGADHARALVLDVDAAQAAWTLRFVPGWISWYTDDGGVVRILAVDGTTGRAGGPRLSSPAAGRRRAVVHGTIALSLLLGGAITGVVGLLLWFLLPVALVLAVVALVFAVLAVVALTRPASWNRAELA